MKDWRESLHSGALQTKLFAAVDVDEIKKMPTETPSADTKKTSVFFRTFLRIINTKNFLC